ncbi:MAG: hypothetical protein EXQ92_06615 [Alphaproteobacteria bacterium]|nr:hypothetical protein [Alphaproteobacteria bacterium]
MIHLLTRLLLIGFVAMTAPPPAEANTPIPLFRGVQQVGLLCQFDSLDGAMGAITAAEFCEFALQRWTDAFAGGPKIEIVLLQPNDGRIVAPATLVVTLYGVARAGGPDLNAPGGSVLALAMTLYRRNPANDLLFGPAPEAVLLSGDEDWRGEVAPALTRLLFAGAAERLGFGMR